MLSIILVADCVDQGYLRIVSTCLAFYLCFSQIELAAVFYTIGQALDAVDGVTARYFNQCSKFGALLDMLTDRMSTAVLLIVLALLYPSMWGVFAFLIVLDIVSHWFQMYWSALTERCSNSLTFFSVL